MGKTTWHKRVSNPGPLHREVLRSAVAPHWFGRPVDRPRYRHNIHFTKRAANIVPQDPELNLQLFTLMSVPELERTNEGRDIGTIETEIITRVMDVRRKTNENFL